MGLRVSWDHSKCMKIVIDRPRVADFIQFGVKRVRVKKNFKYSHIDITTSLHLMSSVEFLLLLLRY